MFKDECLAPSYGGFADRIRLNSEFVYKIPDSIPLDEGDQIVCDGHYGPQKTFVKA
jgi:D-arabinose 1-dehydrogenase-like Zn-dependent alcohol dehydrogenase